MRHEAVCSSGHPRALVRSQNSESDSWPSHSIIDSKLTFHHRLQRAFISLARYSYLCAATQMERFSPPLRSAGRTPLACSVIPGGYRGD